MAAILSKKLEHSLATRALQTCVSSLPYSWQAVEAAVNKGIEQG